MKREDAVLISIIIGMYKGEKYIKECIDSVVNQDYANLEIILIDDGSPDNCGKIADMYAQNDDRIIVVHQENAGVSASRNRALDMAKGDYICIIDQDDVLSTDYVSYFYNLIISNNAQIALTSTAEKFFGTPTFQTEYKDHVEVWNGEQTAIEMLYHKIIIAPWNKMISRKLLDDNHVRFNPEFFGGEGFAFSVQSYQYAERIAVGHKLVYHYRVGDPESGASKFRESTIHSSINAQQYIKDTFVHETPELLKAWKFSNWHTYCDCLNIMVGCGVTKQYRELYKELKQVCKREATCAFSAPISAQQKLRGILFKISPYMAAKIINHFRIRKFAKINGGVTKNCYISDCDADFQERCYKIGAHAKLEELTGKVSVIVPVYNVESFVAKCIESIMNQEYRNLEIILVDDGSTDNSGEICDAFAKKDNRIRVLHKRNAGVSAARNTGIEACTGDYICFVDGDDYVMPDYVEYMLGQITENKADIALTTQMFGNFDEKQVKKDKIEIWNGEDAVEAILCYQVPIGCYCKLFRANFLEGVRFIPKIFIGEGFNFNVEAFQKADKVVAGKRKIYYYRRDNPTSAMTKFSIKKCECGLWALDVIKQNLTIHSKRICEAWRYANWRTHSDFYDMCVLAGVEEEYPEMYKKCLKVTRKDALSALHVPTSKQNKLRAIIMWICPIAIPIAMKVRKLKYHVNVSNR